MKINSKVVALGFLVLLPTSIVFAASNVDRVRSFSGRGSEEQRPQASETKQYCTELNAKVQGGKEKERSTDETTMLCKSAPTVRSSEEARVEDRKIERNPGN